MPVMLIDAAGHAVKTQRFKKRIDLGDPVNAVSLFNAFRVDELILLDIDATPSRRSISMELLSDIASEAKMPFSVGGGLTTMDAIRSVLAHGAEKVVLCTSALENPRFLSDAAERFGSSSIVVCLDVKRNLFGTPKVLTRSGKATTPYAPAEAAAMMERMGAGEIIVQSVDRDGTMAGYDQDLVATVADAVSVPVIALGGAGRLAHLQELYAKTSVSALAAGSLFVFQDEHRGVLINYPSSTELRAFRAPGAREGRLR